MTTNYADYICSIAALQKATDIYSAKVDSASEKALVQLAWNVDDSTDCRVLAALSELK